MGEQKKNHLNHDVGAMHKIDPNKVPKSAWAKNIPTKSKPKKKKK